MLNYPWSSAISHTNKRNVCLFFLCFRDRNLPWMQANGKEQKKTYACHNFQSCYCETNAFCTVNQCSHHIFWCETGLNKPQNSAVPCSSTVLLSSFSSVFVSWPANFTLISSTSTSSQNVSSVKVSHEPSKHNTGNANVAVCLLDAYIYRELFKLLIYLL